MLIIYTNQAPYHPLQGDLIPFALAIVLFFIISVQQLNKFSSVNVIVLQGFNFASTYLSLFKNRSPPST